jgi:uncharacterized protein YjbI with pentapeptide repeats
VAAAALYYRKQKLERAEPIPLVYPGWYGIDDRNHNGAANLVGNDLKYADLRDSNLTGANLEGVNLRGANLQHSGLAVTNLATADLTDALLQKAVLFGANLPRATLAHADLANTNLLLANLLYANLLNTCMNGETVLPDGEYWTPETDIDRFTDPRHPLFWQSPVYGTNIATAY